MVRRKAPAKRKAPSWEWAFVVPYFRVLKGLIAAVDEERVDTSPLDIGRDPETDWWLDVSWDVGLPDMAPPKRKALLRKRREALLLTSVLAEVDYNAWLKYLQKSCGFTAPRFMDLGSKQLRPSFRFLFDSDDDAESLRWPASGRMDHDASGGEDSAGSDDSDSITPYNFNDSVEWEWCAGHLFGTDSFSPKFLKDYHQAMQLVKTLGVAPKTLRAPRIQLAARASLRNPVDRDYLKNIEETLLFILAAKPSPGKPGFVLDSIALDMSYLSVSKWTIPLLQRIAELNIPIRKFDLPCRERGYAGEAYEGKPKWSTVWADFVRALCGISARSSVRTAPVWTLCIPPVSKIERADVVALCSALMESTTIKHVQLLSRAINDFESMFVLDMEEERHTEIPTSVWSWLALALLSKQSSTSVESLTLKGFSLLDSQVSAMEEVVRSQSPLAVMLSKLKSDVGVASLSPPRPIRLRKGAKLLVLSDAANDNSSDWFSTSVQLDGLVLLDDENGDAFYAFIAGYGLVKVSKPARPSKKARVQEADSSLVAEDRTVNSSFKAFKMKSMRGDATSQAAVPRLLDVIGGSLSSLRIKIPDVDEPTADRMLRACPNLTHLTLANTTLSSMDFIEDAIARGTPLSSLALKKCGLPNTELGAFLSKLCDENSRLHASLQRLRIGKRWPTIFEPSTLAIFDRIMHENSQLKHFSYYSSWIKDTDNDFVEMGRATRVAGTGAQLEKGPRFAFLGVVSAIAKKSPRLTLNDHVKGAILEFAADRQRRDVVCWEDALMGGRNPLMLFHQW